MKELFKIQHSERLLVGIATIVFVFLNSITVAKYYDSFSIISENYHKLFVETFHISGFDPLTYEVLSQWSPVYNVFRHPLLAFFLWPVSIINEVLMTLTGMNFATMLTAVILVVCSVYSCIFLFRILHEVIGTTRFQGYALCAMFYGCAFIMLSTMVPDHFVMSMAALLLTLYIAGKKLQKGSALNAWQTVMLFVLTAGISLNNGMKVFLASMLTRRKRFFKPLFLLLVVILPASLIWGFARWEHHTFVYPKERAYEERQKERDREDYQRIYMMVKDSIPSADHSQITETVRRIRQENAVRQYRENRKKIWNRNTGKPIAKGEFIRWTDVTTPRWATCVENLFGEGIQLHEAYLLGDVLRNRPVIVAYGSIANYLVEMAILLLFVLGVWYGRRSMLLWTAMAFFLMDMALHMGLGFGINEIYIMSPHYLFVIPIAIAFLAAALRKEKNVKTARCLDVVIAVIAAWLWIWNGRLVLQFML